MSNPQWPNGWPNPVDAGVEEALRKFMGASEPDLPSAKNRCRKLLLEIRPKWTTLAHAEKRCGMTRRATTVALDALVSEGVAKRGTHANGKTVWRWKG